MLYEKHKFFLTRMNIFIVIKVTQSRQTHLQLKCLKKFTILSQSHFTYTKPKVYFKLTLNEKNIQFSVVSLIFLLHRNIETWHLQHYERLCYYNCNWLGAMPSNDSLINPLLHQQQQQSNVQVSQLSTLAIKYQVQRNCDCWPLEESRNLWNHKQQNSDCLD